MAALAGVKTAAPGGFPRRLRRIRRACFAIADFLSLQEARNATPARQRILSTAAQLGVRRALRFPDDWNVIDSVSDFFAQAATPNVAGQKNLGRGRKRDGQDRPEQAPDEQAPDEN